MDARAFYTLTICGLDELDRHGARGVTHVLSILDPGWPAPAAPAPRAASQSAAAPAVVETAQAPPQGQLDADIGNILAGLSAFTGGN